MRTDTKSVQLLPYEFSNKQVSPWGGMRIVQELVERIVLREILQRQELPQPGSNLGTILWRGYSPVDIVMSFLVSIWTGGNRFAHCALLRYDEVLKKIFRWKDVASESTFSRFLEETFSLMGAMKVGLIQADSGLFSEKRLSKGWFPNFFENKALSYIVAAKFTQRIKKILLNGLQFIPIDSGVEIAEFSYKAIGWQGARRFIVVRKNIKTS